MTSALIEKPKSENTAVAERQVVALHLGEETFGVDIASIHSVLTPQSITVVPNVPHFVKGVMNLRGRIVPVLDLRARFGLPALEASKQKSSRIAIVEADGLTAGLIVDAVSEVLRLSADSIEPPSALLASKDLRCITGIGRVLANPSTKSEDQVTEVRLILLLDIAETLSSIAALSMREA